MRTKTILYFLSVITATITLDTRPVVGQVFTISEVLNNQAIANSPRAKEEFLWIARRDGGSPSSEKTDTKSTSALAKVKKNHTLSASPRMRELYPELSRSAFSASKEKTSPRTEKNRLAEVRSNRALTESPRMRELYPELARGTIPNK